MGVESEMWGNTAQPHEIEWNGKIYKVRLIDGNVKASFERRLFNRARANEDLFKEGRTPEEHKAKLDALADDYLCGAYDIMSPRGLRYMQSHPGMAFLASLLIGCEEKEVYGLVVQKSVEFISLLEVILKESFPGFDPFASKKKEGGIAEALAAPLSANELKEAAGPK